MEDICNYLFVFRWCLVFFSSFDEIWTGTACLKIAQLWLVRKYFFCSCPWEIISICQTSVCKEIDNYYLQTSQNCILFRPVVVSAADFASTKTSRSAKLISFVQLEWKWKTCTYLWFGPLDELGVVVATQEVLEHLIRIGQPLGLFLQGRFIIVQSAMQ